MKIAYWLLTLCALVFLMVIIGGITRLTGSGLSMVEWAPVTGFIPPLNEADWHRLFESYRQYPEFLIVNRGMDLEGFKEIFWLEFIHRVLGRLIGIVFLIPFLYFLVRRMIPRNLTPKLAAMFVLGGMQGVLGWYMVKSGLVDNPHVSQYRLTAHLMMALAIYSYMLWVAMDIISEHRPYSGPTLHYSTMRGRTLAVLFLVVLTIVSGGFVAGLKAGLVYNTFPLMGDSLVPPGAYAMTPWYLSALEDAVTVQFNHRVLAVSTFFVILLFFISSWRMKSSPVSQKLLMFMLVAAIAQVSLGLTTLLLRVPVPVASAHQAGAMILLTTLIVLYHHLKKNSLKVT